MDICQNIRILLSTIAIHNCYPKFEYGVCYRDRDGYLKNVQNLRPTFIHLRPTFSQSIFNIKIETRMTITFVCRSAKVSKKDGLTPLELYIIIDGKRRFVSLNRKIDPKLFNAKKQIVRGDTHSTLLLLYITTQYPLNS